MGQRGGTSRFYPVVGILTEPPLSAARGRSGRVVVRVNAAGISVCTYIREPGTCPTGTPALLSMYAHPSPAVLVSPARGPRGLLLSRSASRARVCVTRRAMLHRATWKFSSLRVHAHAHTDAHGGAGSCPCGPRRGCMRSALRLDRSVNGAAVWVYGRLARARALSCGPRARSLVREGFSAYAIHCTRPANYISR